MSDIKSLFVTRLYHAALTEHGTPVDQAELEASCWSIAEDDEAASNGARTKGIPATPPMHRSRIWAGGSRCLRH